jgi:hypothetical protein
MGSPLGLIDRERSPHAGRAAAVYLARYEEHLDVEVSEAGEPRTPIGLVDPGEMGPEGIELLFQANQRATPDGSSLD